EMLGQGGMGMVYKARQRALDRLVALKVLPQDAARDPAFAERFQREARALARLSHPNIVAVHEFGETAGYYYLVMEFVDGSDLRRVLQQRKLSAEEALRIVPAICDALQYAHASGVVHRDIKPGNILLDRDGRVKIADFGIAKLVGGESPDPTLTQLRQRMGTPHYMAPEQVENPEAVDHRADIFSLGVVFYEMLTGELPLGRFPVPSAKVQVDVRLDEVVLRALEKEPARRYQQAGEVKTEVERISAAGSESRPPRRVAGLTGIGGFGHSEKAVFAMVWAVLLFPLFLVFWSVAARSGRSLPTGIMSVFFLGFVVVCGLAPLGTTLLGMLALRDLCRERRGGAGLGLALVASGLFPTMTLLIAVFGLWALVFGLTIGHAASVMVAPLALVATVATGGPLVVWLGARFWRRAHAAAQNPEAPTGTPIRRWWRSAAVLGSQAVVGFLLVAAFVASTGQSRRPAVNRAPVLERMSTDLATGLPVWVPTRGWEMTTNGPVVTEALSWELPGGMGLQEPQRSALNRALQDGWNEYRKLLASRVSVLTN
ncbi:MAG: serine/threonine protein kinase, partial [Nitrospira sp.]|nr:serine/threonine protein kinase [Nitrospira sp.]